MSVRHIVIFRLGSLGDAIVSLPCWHRIRARFPDARRTLLTNRSISDKAAGVPAVLGGAGFIDDVVEYPIGIRSVGPLWRLARQLRGLRTDMLIYMAEPRCLASVYRDWAFFRLCGFKHIVGLPWRADDRGNRIEPGTGLEEQECLRLARQMAALGPFDLSLPEAWDLRLSAAEMAAGAEATAAFGATPFVAINMGGKDRIKDWGQENWERLVARLGAALPGTGLLTVGAASDSARAAALRSHWPGPMVDVCGALTVRECAAALARARIFVGHDSGPMHLAASQGVACVGLFGDFNRPAKWHPYGSQHRILHRMEGLSSISVAEVLEAATFLWQRARAAA